MRGKKRGRGGGEKNLQKLTEHWPSTGTGEKHSCNHFSSTGRVRMNKKRVTTFLSWVVSYLLTRTVDKVPLQLKHETKKHLLMQAIMIGSYCRATTQTLKDSY